MKRALLLSTFVLPASLAGLAAPANAACVATGSAYECAGYSTGFTNAAGGLTVTVDSGAVVIRTTSDGIRVRGSGNTVVNNGTIIGAGELPDDGTDGIDGGTKLTVINNGTITGSNKGIDAEGKNGLKVVNNGTISAYDKAIRNADASNGRLENNGLIESETDEGFESGDSAYVLNAAGAKIIASDDAIQVGENAEIHNYGLIESVTRGGDEADPQDGIDIDSGSIYNYASGVIRSDDDAAIDYDASTTTSYIDNRGTISGTTGVLVEKGETGEDPNLAAQIIRNWGVIEGRDGLALDLGAGADALTLYTGSQLIGGADFGIGDDSLILDGAFTAYIAGGSWLDGGAGYDSVSFLSFGFDDIASALFGDSSVVLSILTSTSDFTISLINWESFSFGDGTSYSHAALQTALSNPVPVPVPAAGLLLTGGVVWLAALRRRRRA